MIPVIRPRILHDYPHDTYAFTQGLLVHDGTMYESTGLEGQSSIRQVDIVSGNLRLQCNLPRPYFGEGITILYDQLYQLTWKHQIGFRYDAQTFQLLGRFYYPTEGWGLTNDGHHLIMSDGTNELRYRDTDGKWIKTLYVFATSFPFSPTVFRLNALQYIQGYIYANIWLTPYIAKIDPVNGQVVAWIDLSQLVKANPEECANGIAYDSLQNRIYVTGKNWSSLYEIQW